jgi:hypothetical protein
MKHRIGTIAAVGALALASVAPAVANSGNGHGPATAPGKTKTHNVTYVFKGTWTGPQTVSVTHGNAHVRKAGLVDHDVTFDLATTKFVVADTNNDGSQNIADLKDGDRVVVKARLPRKDPGTQPFRAKMLIDQSSRPAPAGADD